MRTPKPGEWLAERTDIALPPDTVRELAAKAPAAHARTYRMCGRMVRLGCDDARYAARFAGAFRHLAAPPDGEPATDLVFLTRNAGPDGFPALLELAAGRARVFEHESVSPTQLCVVMFLGGALPVTDRVVLHASVLERKGLVTAFLGRTHAGKTTLALALALEKGVGFLSDEYCPIRLADGFVEPFPRILGIRPWTRKLLAEKGALPEGIGEGGGEGQLDVDPASLRGFRLGEGGPLRNVVVVSGEAGDEAPQGIRDLDVEFVSPGLLGDLRAVPGVREVERRPERVGSGHLLRVHVDAGAAVTDALLAVCERHGMRLHGLLPAGAKRPDFKEPPLLRPMDAFKGLVEVLRHTVNRTALEHHLGDTSLPRLLDAIAPALKATRFLELRPGPLDATVRLVMEKLL